MRHSLLVVAIAANLFLAATARAGGITLVPANNTFTSPNVGGGYEYGTITGWNSSSGTGVAANGSAFNVSGSPSGQAAFLQGNGSNINQSVSGFGAGPASVSFNAEERAYQNGNQSINVYLGNSLVGVVTPQALSTSSFTPFTTTPVAVSAGANSVGFTGSNSGGDQTGFVEGVVLNATSPGSYRSQVLYPTNNGFESPNLGTGSNAYEYSNVPGWTATGGAGIAANGSAFNVAGAMDGNNDGAGGAVSTTSTAGQAGVLQGGDGTLNSPSATSITQTVSGFWTGSAVINFSAEERSYNGNSSLLVYLDGRLVDTITPSQLRTGSFTAFNTNAVAVSAGSHTIGFAGYDPGGDNTVFVDNVSITNATPEPTSLVLMGLGGIGLVLARRRCRLA